MKRPTAAEEKNHEIRERLIAYKDSLKASIGGNIMAQMEIEIPCSHATLSRIINRQIPLRGMTAVAIESYLERKK